MIKTSQRLLALFMVIAMVATACGGSDDESSDAVDTAATDTTAEENQETAD
jgi:ABC-type glycerol-3-phosphate transport system substrate-binding protein